MAELLKLIKLRPNLAAATIITILGVLIHLPFLFFGLTSDHLLAIYEWRGRFLVPSIGSFQAFINPYGASAILTRTIDVLWGDNAFVFFLIAIILKIIASYSLYLLSKEFLKSSTLSILIGALSVVAFAGIQGVAPGGTVHISLFLLNIGLITAIRNKEKILSKEIISLVFYVASFAITPTRMYPILPIVLLFELSELFIKRRGAVRLLAKVVFMLIAYQILKNIGLIDSYGTAAGVASTLTSVDYYKEASKFISIGIYSLASISQVVIPDQILGLLFMLFAAFVGTSLFAQTAVLQITTIIGFILSVYKTKVSRPLLILGLIALTLVTSSFVTSLSAVPTGHKINVFIGTLYLCGVLILGKKNWDKPTYHALVIFSLSPIMFLAAPYLLYQFGEQETLSRYFSAASMYGPLVLALFLVLIGLKRKLIYCVLILFIILNSYSSINYQHSAGQDGTYQFYLDRVFTKMNSEIGARRGKPRPLVFVRGDNGNFLSTTITNLGDVRFSLHHKNLSENQRPIFVTSKEKLVEYFEKLKEENKDKEFVYGFEIKNKEIYSITKEVRDYLYSDSDQF